MTSNTSPPAAPTLAQMPISAGLAEGVAIRWRVERLALRVGEGAILNPEFQELKSSLNRLLEEVIEKGYSNLYCRAGRFESQSKAMQQFGYAGTQLHVLAGRLKRLEKIRDGGASQAALLAILREWVPVAWAVEWLKGRVVKRVPGPTAAQKQEAALVPLTPQSALVKQVISDAIEGMRPGLVSLFKEQGRRLFASAVERFGAALAKPARNAPSLEQDFHFYWTEELRHFVTIDSDRFNPKPAVLSESKLDSEAHRFVDEMFRRVAIKMMAKAGMLESPSVARLQRTEFTLAGKLHGAEVLIDQKFMLNRSVYGKRFSQYPARILVDAKVMSEADYKRWMLEGGVHPPERR